MIIHNSNLPCQHLQRVNSKCSLCKVYQNRRGKEVRSVRPDYDGVKFYSKDDLSIGWGLEKAESIIIATSEAGNLDSINEIIELYNIQELMDTGITLSKWSAARYRDLKSKAKSFTGIIAEAFSRICDENFIEVVQNVAVGYLDDFWTLFSRFKVYQRITSKMFEDYLQFPDTSLYLILKHKDIVKAYDIPLANELRTSEQTCRILATCFLEKSNEKYYLPD